MPRQAFITPLQHLWLLASNEGRSQFLAERGHMAQDSTPLVYSSMIQSGVDQLAFTSGASLPANLAPHLSKRIVRRDTPSYFEVVDFVSQVLRDTALERDEDQQPIALIHLWAFLIDVFHGLHLRSPIITFMEIPKAADFIPLLQPEAAIPIANLVSSIQVATLDVATPASSIPVRDAALLEEVLNDVAFCSYMEKHTALEATDASLSDARQLIASASRSIVERHSRILRLERFSTSTLQISAKLIDTVLGGIPGKIGAQLVASAEKVLHERKRIVLYRYGDLIAQVREAQLGALFRRPE